MSFIDMGNEFSDVKEAVLAPEGEYDLKIQQVEHVRVDANGNTTEVDELAVKNNLRVMVVFEGGDNFAPFTHFISLPSPNDDTKDIENGKEPGSTRRFKMLQIKRFLFAFDIPVDGNGFNPIDFQGQRAKLGVSQRSYKDNATGEERIAQQLKLPRLPEGK